METGQKQNNILNVLSKIPALLLIPFVLCILAVSLIKRAEFCGYKYGDKPVWIREDTVSLILMVIFLLIVFIIVYWLCKKLDQFNRKKVVWLLLFLSAVVQTAVILFLPAKQFADQDSVNRIALQVINGNFIHFQEKGYLYRYPNNVGITVLLSLIYSLFPDTILVPKLINILFSSITSYLVFRIYEETCSTKKDKGYGILIFSGFFLPMLLLNNLIYNDLIATTLFAGLVFHAIRFVKTKRWPHLVMISILAIAGNFLRNVGVIFLIAITLYFILNKIKITKAFMFFGIVLILSQLPLALVNGYLLNTGKITEPLGENSIPIHMWINIGMNEKKIGYWDDAKSFNVYIHEGQWNKAKSTAIYTEMIKKNIKDRGAIGILETYIKKNIWLWTEGTYQAEYYGIGSWGYLYPTFATEFIGNNMLIRDFVRWVLHTTNLLMLGLTTVGLFRSLKTRASLKYEYPLILPAIVLLGFIGFYTLWEIKPRYIYLIYPYLILMFYHGLAILADKLTRLLKHSSKPEEININF